MHEIAICSKISAKIIDFAYGIIGGAYFVEAFFCFVSTLKQSQILGPSYFEMIWGKLRDKCAANPWRK